MNVTASWRRVRRLILTKYWWSVGPGIALTAIVTFVSIFEYGLMVGPPGFAGGAIGGFVAGVLFGKNVIDAAAIGFQVGVVGSVIAAIGVSVLLLVVWFLDSGQPFVQVSFLYFSLIVSVYVPLNGLAAAVGSAVGTTLRREVVPTRYNPPPY